MKESFDVATIINKLSIEDMESLIDTFSDRIFITRRTGANESTMDELDKDVPCCINGTFLQINASGMFDKSTEPESEGKDDDRNKI